MALELKRDRTTAVGRVATNVLNRRALLVTSLAIAGALGAGAGLGGAQEPAKAAQSAGRRPATQMSSSPTAPGPTARAGPR